MRTEKEIDEQLMAMRRAMKTDCNCDYGEGYAYALEWVLGIE